MKKIISTALTMVMSLSCLGMTVQAKVGDVVGTALHTDIVVYINNYAIPSYAVNGQSVVVAEDLRNFGFNVVWNEFNRSLNLYRNPYAEVMPMYVGKGYTTGAKYTDILETDIAVWAGNQKLTSYAMNGYTMIPIEELTMFGEVHWVQNERALKMWINDMEMCETKQVVSYKYYPGTYAPDFGWITDSICLECEDGYGGETSRIYYADSSKLKQYENYIKNNGWYLDKIVDIDGIWYSGYVNGRLRTGIAVSEYEGVVSVQIGTNMDYWVK